MRTCKEALDVLFESREAFRVWVAVEAGFVFWHPFLETLLCKFAPEGEDSGTRGRQRSFALGECGGGEHGRSIRAQEPHLLLLLLKERVRAAVAQASFTFSVSSGRTL